jgi:molecular chaperone GrpE
MSHSTTEEIPATEPAVLEPVAETEVMPAEVEAPPADPLSTLQAEVEKWKDLAHRSAAELDNYRKRAARDMQDARAYANADLLRSLFPILDNFEMGLEAARTESEQSMIYMGLNMVKRQLTDFLKDMGVEEIQCQGVPFDPNLHEAVSQEASTEIPEGQVIRVLRRGFKLKDRLLRAATVIVSSGTPADSAA